LRYQREYAAIVALERELAEQIEVKHPGHPLGRLAPVRSDEFVQQTRDLAPLLELAEDELELATLCAAGRNLGRYIELRAALDPKRKGPGHGILGRIALECSGALAGLEPSYAGAVLDAIEWHTAPSAQLTGLSSVLCYVLQDVARARFESTHASLEVIEIGRELETLFLPNMFNPDELAAIRADLNYAECMSRTTQELLTHCQGLHPDLPLMKLQTAVKDVFWGAIPPDMILRFERGERLTKADWIGSYPAYVLFVIDYIERVCSRRLKDEIYSSLRMKMRLRFIETRVPDRQFERIRDACERRALKAR
jgi:hypothetical protein